MIAYTGIETISNMAEEAKDAARTIPRSVGLVVAAVLGLYLLIPIVALSAMPVTQDAAGHYTTALGTDVRQRPDPRHRREPRPLARARPKSSATTSASSPR